MYPLINGRAFNIAAISIVLIIASGVLAYKLLVLKAFGPLDEVGRELYECIVAAAGDVSTSSPIEEQLRALEAADECDRLYK